MAIKEMSDRQLINALWQPFIDDDTFGEIENELKDRGYIYRNGWIKEKEMANRFEWKLINVTLNLFGLYDNIRHEYIIETTRAGMEAYKKLGF